MPRDPWSGFTDERVTRALKVLMIVVLAMYVGQYAIEILARIRTVVYVLIGAVFFAYLIYPLVKLLSRRMPVVAAIVLVYAALLGAFAAAAVYLIPHFIVEMSQIVAQYPILVGRVDQMIADPNDPFLSHLSPWMRAELLRVPGEIAAWIKIHGIETFSHALVVLMGTAAIVATFVIIPMVAAYLLLDLPNLRQALFTLIPQRRRAATIELLHEFDMVVGGFIRGQMLVALCVGVLVTISLLVLHVRYAFLLGLLAAIGDLIPYVGAILAFIPAVASAWINNGPLNALIVAVVFIAIFQAEGHFIAPNVVSKQVKLSPFVVLLALLVGGDLAGLVGMLVAVPVAGVIRAIVVRVFPAKPTNEAAP
ncbi:MAG TPA: AI-2E family transporter [Verrucomicrobiae bacterium]|nr:AI-2E family transporter [Verrucomicrobiae bacterium]